MKGFTKILFTATLLLSSIAFSLSQSQKKTKPIIICTNKGQVRLADKELLSSKCTQNLPFIQVDKDGDGYTEGNPCSYLDENDCDDNDPLIFPGSMTEVPSRSHSQILSIRFRHFDTSAAEERVYFGKSDLGQAGNRVQMANSSGSHYWDSSSGNLNTFTIIYDPLTYKMSVEVKFKSTESDEIQLASGDFQNLNGLKLMIRRGNDNGNYNNVAFKNLKYNGKFVGDGTFEDSQDVYYKEWYYELCFDIANITMITGEIYYESGGFNSRGERTKLEIHLITLN